MSENIPQNGQKPNATTAMVLGIISAALGLFGFVFGYLGPIGGLVCGIIGLVQGSKAKKICKNNSEYANLLGKANAGFICSIVGISVCGLILLYL